MKRLGLLGGLSWVSTIDYYRYINEGINQRLGELEFAECILYSLNFGDIQRNGWDNWEKTFALLSNGCRNLKAAGAEAIVLCANTAHALADELERDVGLPLIHIATATADEIHRNRLTKVGFLGTKFSMELPFFHDALRAHDIESFTPRDKNTREFIQRTLRDELGRDVISSTTKQAYLGIIDTLIAEGAQGIVLGCTEIPLLISQEDVSVPLFDTTHIHARAAVDFALG